MGVSMCVGVRNELALSVWRAAVGGVAGLAARSGRTVFDIADARLVLVAALVRELFS